MQHTENLFAPLELPCGAVLKNRIIKSAMSDSLGDGTGHPTDAQNSLYQKWAAGGLAASIIGEVQSIPGYAEKPGNLVLNDASDLDRFRTLAQHGQENGAQLWLQLGHAGALAYGPTSDPKGPSTIDLPELKCGALSVDDIARLPAMFGKTAMLAQKAGFGGVQIHAAHGFLLSQFLSPLFNQRNDAYGGSITNRMRLILDVIHAVRGAVGPDFPVSIKLNSSDQLEGGLARDDALEVVKALDQTSIDLIDISGGTYFPGAKSASDGAGAGPYFIEFAKRARDVTTKPLMLTGGFKTHAQAQGAIGCGVVDVVGLARALVVEPSLPDHWQAGELPEPAFPRFSHTPEGGVTAWYTMRLTDMATGAGAPDIDDIDDAIARYGARDAERTEIWLGHFGR
ncbi:NADH:flavin oxidoreductase/NADH oxidase family protein [Thalassospira sp. MA62]|nr:NADH:flavin oxidoreductase/NADH oxidase family protein [Thalassospira sp. MA62]